MSTHGEKRVPIPRIGMTIISKEDRFLLFNCSATKGWLHAYCPRCSKQTMVLLPLLHEQDEVYSRCLVQRRFLGVSGEGRCMHYVRFLACARCMHPDHWEQKGMCGFSLPGQSLAAAYAIHGRHLVLFQKKFIVVPGL